MNRTDAIMVTADSKKDKIIALLKQLSQDLLATSQQTSNSSSSPQTIKDLKENSNPANTMSILVPFLFKTSKETISSGEALTLMAAFVASEPDLYLKPASHAVLQEATRLSNNNNNTEPLFVSPQLLHVIVSQLRGEDVQVADNATKVLHCVARRLGSSFVQPAMQVIRDLWKESWQQFIAGQNTTSLSSTTCVRCANAVKELALINDAFMGIALSGGASETWTDMLTYEADPLIQLSALDLFEQLASTQPFHPTRTQWLLTSSRGENFPLRTVLRMAGGMSEEESSSSDPLLGGAALRVVARLCKLLHGDAAAEQDGHFLLTSFHQALHHWDEQSSSSEVDRFTILDAISSFASASDEALDLVLEDPVTRYAWLSLNSVAQSKLKAAILISVAHVLDPSMLATADTENWTPPSNSMAIKLFASIGETNASNFRGDTMDLLLNLVRSPIPEVRLGVYELLRAVAKMPTAGQVLWNHGEFFPMLLSRDTEPTVEGREAKYAIVQAILVSPLKGLLSEDLVKLLEKYSDQGPHYKKVQSWDVATE